MGNKKTTKSNQQTSTRSTYGWMTPPTNPYTSRLEDELEESQQADPSIAYRMARRRQRVRNRFGSIAGANYAPETQEAIMHKELGEIDLEHGQALQEDSNMRSQRRFGQLMSMAMLNQPRLVQTSTSGQSSGTTVEKDNALLMGFIGGAMNAGFAAI